MSKIYTALGTMSGTSIDGIDFSIIQTDGKNHLRLIKNHYLSFNNKLKRRVKAIKFKIKTTNQCKSIIKTSEYKNLLKDITELHIKGIKTIIKNVKKKPIDIIGLHGVTICHKPKERFTHQIIDTYLIKKKIKKNFEIKNSNLIFDFRKKDIMNGGQGAPLTPIYHQVIMRNFKFSDPVLVVNIGGITNVTYLNRNNIFSTDIGPGNCLLDNWVKKKNNKDFDKNGKISLKGKINYILANNFLNKIKKVNKNKNFSYDTSDFKLTKFYKLKLEDGAATLSYVTAKLILNCAKNFNQKIIILCGGGRWNQAIINNLKKEKFEIKLIDDLNFGKINQGDFIESQAFAYLGVRSYLNLPISFPTTTGVKKACSGGVIFKS